MAASTSRAAPSTSRLRSNCSVTEQTPSVLEEVIWLTPAICPNWRSSGVATEEAITSGLAPGSAVATVMVAKSIWGSEETGRLKKASMPASVTAMVSRVVATGRRMKGAEMFMRPQLPGLDRRRRRGLARKAGGNPVKENVDDRRGVEREHLADEQSADHRDAQWTAQLRADAAAEGQRDAGEQRGQGGHEDRPEAKQRGFIDRLDRSSCPAPVRLRGRNRQS